VTFLATTRTVVILLLAGSALVHANIGDDIGQVRGRYGAAKDMNGQLLFQHDGYSICVYFDGSHVAMEVFVRDGSVKEKTDITQDDVDTILASEGPGFKWNEVETPTGKKMWLRSDNKMIARLSVDDKSNEKTLMIMLNAK
jgi:hypothetical protein